MQGRCQSSCGERGVARRCAGQLLHFLTAAAFPAAHPAHLLLWGQPAPLPCRLLSACDRQQAPANIGKANGAQPVSAAVLLQSAGRQQLRLHRTLFCGHLPQASRLSRLSTLSRHSAGSTAHLPRRWLLQVPPCCVLPAGRAIGQRRQRRQRGWRLPGHQSPPSRAETGWAAQLQQRQGRMRTVR